MFEFPLVPSQSVVRLTTSDVRHLKFIVADTRFASKTPKAIVTSLQANSSHGGESATFGCVACRVFTLVRRVMLCSAGEGRL